MELGTAVGIASFGIQVCQGLLSYYNAWKAYDSDMSSTFNTITDLNKTLTLLKDKLQQELMEERAGRVRTCVESCEGALLELEKKRLVLQSYGQPEGLRQKMRSGLQRSWYPFRKETLESLKVSVVSVQERLQLALQVLQLEVDIESQALIHRVFSQITMQCDQLAQLTAQSQLILNTQKSAEFRRIVAWLAPPDPETNHDIARQHHEHQTGDWLLESVQYKNWKAGAVSHLWLYGKAGCGKTILCSTAIEDILHDCESDLDTRCAFFYFSFSDQHKQSDRDLLLSLVAQLGWREPGFSMLHQAYDNPTRRSLGLAELEKILLASVRSFGRVYLLMDALDECTEEEDVRERVLEQIKRLTRGSPNLKIFSTSREIFAIHESMKALPARPISIPASAVDADIRVYVAKQLFSDRTFAKFNSTTVDLIEDTITKKADGMFRWAYCQLQALKRLKCSAPKYMKRTLDTLPATLDETYTQTLLEIEDMYRDHAITLLLWLAYARSPLTLAELAEAAIVDPTFESSIDTENRGNLEDALKILGGLVTIEGTEVPDKQETTLSRILAFSTQRVSANFEYQRRSFSSTTVVRLAHFSVKEYLESPRILATKAHRFFLDRTMGHRLLSQSCLTYLRYYSASGEKTSTKQDLELFPLLKYAAQSWYHHSALQHGEVSREVSLLSLDGPREDWLRVRDPDTILHATFEKRNYSGSALYYASRVGLESVARDLIRGGLDVNTSGGRYGNALQAAAIRGHMGLLRLLLDHGADVNAQGGHCGNSLQAASFQGCIEIVELLLHAGASVNAQGGFYGNALQAASNSGHMDVVQMLLRKDATVSVRSGRYGSAIQAASIGGHMDVVRLLLAENADVNAPGGNYGSALQAASSGGYLDVVQLLLDNGAIVDTRGGVYGNALQAALAGGYIEVVELLQAAGARNS